MEKNFVELPKVQLVGIKIRTSYDNEINPLTGQIGPTIQRYWQEGIADKIPNRANPGRLFSVYTEYESDHTGAYTYFLGEEVTHIDEPLPDGLCAMELPLSNYTKFTTNPAPLPHVIIDAWYKIWQMSAEDLGGERRWIADFEIYDERAQNPLMAVVDIYIGLK